MLTIASGLIDFSMAFDKDKSVNSLTTTVDGTVDSMLGCDNVNNKEDKIKGSIVLNIYGEEVMTVVNCTSVVGNCLWIDFVMGASKALVMFGGMVETNDGTNCDILCKKQII